MKKVDRQIKLPVVGKKSPAGENMPTPGIIKRGFFIAKRRKVWHASCTPYYEFCTRMHITITDYHNLMGLIEMARLKNKESEVMKKLLSELKQARRVSQVNIPRKVVTMNSKVMLVEEETGKQVIITLVYPHSADTSGKKLSVFSSAGSALLGASEGDTIGCGNPSVRYKILKVLYQPEAEGHYHL
jgi:regulator of nucleoside diphosphate kinase